MNVFAAIRHLQRILEQAPNCSIGIAAQRFVVGMETGPSGSAELLAALYVDDPFWGFWYGHIVQHPRNPKKFVALLVWTDKFINANRIPLLFQRFHYWIKERLSYQPCAIQSEHDAYKECNSLELAVLALGDMIRNFDIDKRTAYEGSSFEHCLIEARIVDVYGLGDKLTDNSIRDRCPSATNLALVKNQK